MNEKNENERTLNEEKLTELEIQIAYQEDTITTLNDIVYKQQQAIDRLEKTCSTLVKKVGDMSVQLKRRDESGPLNIDPSHEVPPHY